MRNSANISIIDRALIHKGYAMMRKALSLPPHAHRALTRRTAKDRNLLLNKANKPLILNLTITL